MKISVSGSLIVVAVLALFTILAIGISEEKSRTGQRLLIRSNCRTYATREILEVNGGIKFLNASGDSIFIFGNYTIEKHVK